MLVPTGEPIYDSVIGDPRFTVKLPSRDEFLCYEIHGEAGKYFNLISDTCISVNALFSNMPFDPRLNRISEIGIYTSGTMDNCAKIKITLEGCSGYVDGLRISSIYRQSGIDMRFYLNRWRISVPMCFPTESLIMWIFCEQEPDMLQLHIARGNYLTPDSHGLLGNKCIIFSMAT